jgi:hypothetical protein
VSSNNNIVNKSQGKTMMEAESIDGPDIRMNIINGNF